MILLCSNANANVQECFKEKSGPESVEPVDAARASPGSDAASSMQQPQTVRERELEAEVQMLKAILEVTATIAAQRPDLSLLQSYPEWLEVDGFLTGLMAMDEWTLREIFEQFADIQEEAEDSAAKETATDDVSGSGAVIETENENNDQSNPEFTEIFSWFDADGDGSITENELTAALRKFLETFDGVPGDEKEKMLQSVEPMSQKIIADCDANGNGTLEFPEFLKFLEVAVKRFPPGSQAHLLELAREGNAANAEAKEKAAAEAETDKRLSKEGLAKMFETKNITLSKGKLEELMRRIDTDGNGEIDWLEFRALARSNSDLVVQASSAPSDIPYSSPGDSDALFAVRLALVKDPKSFFELGDSENLEDLSVQDFKRACEASVKVKGIRMSEGAVERLFRQLDRDNSGTISLEELKQDTMLARHFYKEAMVEDVILAALVGLSRRQSNGVHGEDFAHLSLDLVRDSLKDTVPEALATRAEEVKDTLGRMEKAVEKQNDQGIGKYDMATYGEVTAYAEGLSAIGTPHPNILEQMKKEVTKGPDCTDIFRAWNSGPNDTFSLKEWDFLYEPFVRASVSKNKPPREWKLEHDYGGNRFPIRLEVFLHVLSATQMTSGIRFGNYKKAHKLLETDSRWLHPDEVDFVHVIILRFVKSQLDAVSLINAFSKKAGLKGKYKLESASKKVDRIVVALSEGLHERDGSASSCTYDFLVGKLKGMATEEELEAILDHYHAKFAEENMSEAEVIGMREYSGPLYVKVKNGIKNIIRFDYSIRTTRSTQFSQTPGNKIARAYF
jgi:Ca2+-binding EF-hand superfamily protein